MTAVEAAAALAQLRLAPLLSRFRGQPPRDAGAVAQLMVQLSQPAVGHPDLSVDLNPVLLHPEGYAVADLRVLGPAAA